MYLYIKCIWLAVELEVYLKATVYQSTWGTIKKENLSELAESLLLLLLLIGSHWLQTTNIRAKNTKGDFFCLGSRSILMPEALSATSRREETGYFKPANLSISSWCFYIAPAFLLVSLLFNVLWSILTLPS